MALGTAAHLEHALSVLIVQGLPGGRIPLLNVLQLTDLQMLTHQRGIPQPIVLHEAAAGPCCALISGCRQRVGQLAGHLSRQIRSHHWVIKKLHCFPLRIPRRNIIILIVGSGML